MPGLAAVAAVTPDNTPHGYNLTFAVPIVVFAVVAVALYLLFSRPHQRIPARRGVLPAGRLAAPDAAGPAGVGGAGEGGAGEGVRDAEAGPPDGGGPAAAGHPEDGQ